MVVTDTVTRLHLDMPKGPLDRFTPSRQGHQSLRHYTMETSREYDWAKMEIKTKPTQPKQTTARKELKKAMMKRENMSKDSRQDFMVLERQKAVLQLSILTKRAEMDKMDRIIAEEEKVLKALETQIEKDNRLFEECLKEHEKKSVEARTFFEHEARSKHQKSVETKKLMAEIATIESDVEKIEETLMGYKHYKDLLFKLSPVEWQEKQLAKARNKTDLIEKKTEDKSSMRKSSTQRDTECSLIDDELQCHLQEDPELFFSDPQQLQDLLTELTEQNLSLIQNSARVEETLEELRATITSTKQHIEEEEQLLSHQIDNMKQRIEMEKSRGNKLRQKVQLHVSLNTQDQDVLLDALGDKVSQVHQGCVDNCISSNSTLEKLTQIESTLSELLQNIESIPEESLDLMRRVKESEKRARQREEKLREQQEKQKERMRRYLERSMSEPKKVFKKRPMPKFVLVVQKAPVSQVEDTTAEDEIQKYLFPSDDSD
ncbi:cilia- and flagella-associated protein 100 [Periophthalmus magnuspinnatus]|uniref:cilia- and flagella-associated protein 100 n=1 Tax=Periophthalmus magnuspinnatus TaxID=409849 RepID=UPI002436CFF3|nr:cilia- and flagella-associated protein 100 [Periophthalmus magnuspinnatus]